MPSPKKRSKSPARARSRQRSRSSSRSRSNSRGRPPSSGKKSRSTVDSSTVKTSSFAESPRKSKRSVIVQEKTVTAAFTQEKASVTPVRQSSRVSSLVEQERASVTPIRQSSRISSLVEQEKHASSKIVEKITSEVKTNMAFETEKPVAQTKHYEFGGPLGALLMIFLLPTTVVYVNWACNKGKCSIMELPKLPKLSELVDNEATALFFGWFFFQVLLAILPTGRIVQGQPLRSGERLKYRLNGFVSLVISLVGIGVAFYFKVPLETVHKKFFSIMTAAIVFSFFLSLFLYIKARFFVPPSKFAAPGNSGNPIYDFFMGHELNPRIGPLDLKFFCELRPGLIGWFILNVIFMLEAYQKSGTTNLALYMVAAFQCLYVADGLWNENAILTTMDIVHDGFGFMLAFGDLAWVPFLYCLQPRYLLESKVHSIPWYCLIPIALINVIGYYIFRASNSEKNKFREDPKNPALAYLETIPTPSGKHLLVSGWWGLCRKPNYLGDLLMALAWSLPCGFDHILPYFYPLYFFVLLVHRERRDAAECKRKYGACWDRYCERVRYRIIPYVY